MAYRDPLEAAAERTATLTTELARVEAALAGNEALERERVRLREELARADTSVRDRKRSRHLTVLDARGAIRGAKLCAARWDDMRGTARKRRCHHCARDVYDLSAHSREEALRLLETASEYARFGLYRRSDGTVVRNDCDAPSTKRLRRLAIALCMFLAIACVVDACVVVTLPALRRARETQTRADAQEVRAAALRDLIAHPDASCPTVDELTRSGALDAKSRVDDAWDHRFVIECAGDDIAVLSAGPDGRLSTSDDVW